MAAQVLQIAHKFLELAVDETKINNQARTRSKVQMIRPATWVTRLWMGLRGGISESVRNEENTGIVWRSDRLVVNGLVTFTVANGREDSNVDSHSQEAMGQHTTAVR